MNKIEINGIKVPYLAEINLRDLFTKPYDNLPDLVDTEYVIYCIYNTVNGKAYIGRANHLYARFVTAGELSHLTGYYYYCITKKGYLLYRSLNKYKCRSFKVFILESYLDNTLLDDREIYWIKTLHTCIYDDDCNGYNMTWGGQDARHLHTPEALAKSMATREEWYGDVMGPCRTPEAIAKALENNRKNHGGKLYIHTKECLDIQRANHGGVLACNTEEANISRKVTWLIDSMKTYLDKLHKDNAPLPITFKLYWDWSDGFIKNTDRHFYRIKELYEVLLDDPRITDEMKVILLEYKFNKNKYNIPDSWNHC